MSKENALHKRRDGNLVMTQMDLRDKSGTPIWLAALAATGCQAVTDRGCQAVGWQWRDGRAIYTNVHAYPVSIQPFGVTLGRGETLSVTWIPGETEYTLDVAGPQSKCA
jgi:hypothetical protein